MFFTKLTIYYIIKKGGEYFGNKKFSINLFAITRRKETMKSKFKVLLLLFSLIIIIFGNKLMVSAKDNSYNTKNENIVNASKSYEIENYFSYELGYIRFKENEKIVVNTVSNQISLDKYDFYKIDNTDYEENIYAADIFSKMKDLKNQNIYGVFVIPKNVAYNYKHANEVLDTNFNNYNTLIILYYDYQLNSMKKIISILEPETYNSIIDYSKSLDIVLEDEITDSLKFSLSAENEFKSQISDINENEVESLSQYDLMNSVVYANENQTVTINQWDKYYTNSKNLLHDYNNLYFRNNHQYSEAYLITDGIYNENLSDDPIVNIIPRTYFTQTGKWTYLGVNYGFYIHTYVDYGSDLLCDFFVFEVEQYQYGFTSTGYVSINPLFGKTINYDSDLNIVAQYDGINSTKYALSNIKVIINIHNKVDKNIGDIDYKPFEDMGYYFNTYDINGVGVGKNSNKESTDALFINSLIGMTRAIPYVNFVTTPVSWFLSGLESTGYYKSDLICENPDIIFTADEHLIYNNSKEYTGNAYSQIETYGNLIKSIKLNLVSSDLDTGFENPLLYKPEDPIRENKFEIKYTLIQSDSKINRDAIINTQFSLDIMKDTTYKNIFGWPCGDLTKEDSVTGHFAYEYNEKPSTSDVTPIYEDEEYRAIYGYILSTEVPTNWYQPNFIPPTGTYEDFTFTPNDSYRYVIETYKNYSYNLVYDTYIRIYKDGLQIGYDDDSGQGSNSRLEIVLTEGEEYTIRVHGYRFKGGFCNLIIRRYESINLLVNDPWDYSTRYYNNNSLWFTFIPTDDYLYTIYTRSSTSVNTFLTLYDQDFNLISYDDNSGYYMNASIDLFLQANQKYHIKATSYYPGYFSVIVNIQQVIIPVPENTIFGGGFIDHFYIRPMGAEYYRFELTDYVSIYSTYILEMYTVLTDQSVVYPDILLLDGNMNFLNYASGGNTPAYLQYSFEKDNIYYIQLSMNISSNEGGGNFYFMFPS